MVNAIDFLRCFLGGFAIATFILSLAFGNMATDSYNQAVMDCKENRPICEATYQKVMAERNLSAIISETNK